MPTLFRDWPQQQLPELPLAEVISLYERGYMGAKFDPAAKAQLQGEVEAEGGVYSIVDAAHANGWADSHAGKLVVPFVHVEQAYPGCWPGPAQQRGDCVSHGSKNACLLTMCCEVAAGLPDQVSGKVETYPECPPEGIRNGVLSTEAIYWFRGHGGDGWSCHAAARVSMTHAGCVVRKAYPEVDIDLTKYSGRLAGTYGRNQPPANICDALDNNLIRTVAEASSFEEVRDAIGNGYGINSCGGEGFSSTRDENGVSRRQGGWSHAMGVIGADDRDVIKQKYGEPLALILNSWGKWNSGPRTILGTNVQIPEGSFWARWSDVKRRSFLVYSSVNGWPRRDLPDLNPGW